MNRYMQYYLILIINKKTLFVLTLFILLFFFFFIVLQYLYEQLKCNILKIIKIKIMTINDKNLRIRCQYLSVILF